MKVSRKRLSICFCLFVLFISRSAVVSATITPTPQVQVDALVAIYQNTDGPGWTLSTNWLNNGPSYDPCNDNWYGVTCDGSSNVVGLDLKDNKLKGTIPPEIGNLAYLTTLSFWNNQLSGSIPSQLGNLIALTTLDLGSNLLTGTIPSQLGLLTALQFLYLDNNKLTGSIPAQIGYLIQMDTLNLAHNLLTGDMPAVLVNLVNLTYLDVSYNRFKGALPELLGALTSLNYLFLNNNMFCGSVPTVLANLVNLAIGGLNIGYNYFDKISSINSFLVNRSNGDWAGTQGAHCPNSSMLLFMSVLNSSRQPR